jgi:hypothetical protein
MLEPSFDPIMNMTHEAAKEHGDPEGLGSVFLGERIKWERGNKS